MDFDRFLPLTDQEVADLRVYALSNTFERDAEAERRLLGEVLRLHAQRDAERSTEARKCFCLFCFAVISYPAGDKAAMRAAYEAAFRHSTECPESPVVRRMAELSAVAQMVVDRLECHGSPANFAIVEAAQDALLKS